MTHSKAVFLRALDPAILLGLVGSAIYYAVMLGVPSMHGTALYRYTTEHAVEFVIVTFFICGLADVVLKSLTFPREKLALKQDWLPVRQGREPAANATVLLAAIRKKPTWLQESKLGKRLIQALGFVTEKGRADEYREHLQYLADQDDDHTHSSYGLIRFVMGASPVLGFLGTVIHFGSALSGNSYDDLADRLPSVVSEMGAAFNTTTVALASAMTMMFTLFLCERIDRGILRSIDRLIERELLNRFEIKDPSITPFLTVLQSASNETLKTIEGTLSGQVEVWTRSLDRLFELVDQRQQHELQNWQAALVMLQQRHETYDSAREDRLRQTLAVVDHRHEQQLAHIQRLLDQALGFRDDFGVLTNTLDGIARGEGKLVEQQRVLTDNLRVLRETSQIDQALHGLTAAIHLMTARQGLSNGRDAAAAA